MTPTVSLTPYYRYFALVCLALTGVCVAGMFAYETLVGPIPKGTAYGVWFAQTLSSATATASRFVQRHRRCPTEEEKAKLARVSLGLATAISILPGVVIAAWVYVMAFVFGDPGYEIAYYVNRQQFVSLLMSLDMVLCLVIAGGMALLLTVSYFMMRWQYGSSARRMAGRLSL